MIIDHPKTTDIPTLRRLWQEAFSDSEEFLDTFFACGFQEDHALVVKKEGIAAALYWFDLVWENKPLAYIYAVATEQKSRGQGIGSALLKALHTRLANNYTGAVLVPEWDSLRHFYEKFGYRSFGGMERISCTAEGEAVAYEVLSAKAYMARREGLLPKGSIQQGEKMLPFLDTQLNFYGGDGWLLSARWEEGNLYVPEFLGDRRILPQILQSLQAKEGQVLVAGETPYAMFKPLEETEEIPAYFAFALD